MTKEDIDLVRLALSVYHTRTVYPGCVEAFERIVQEKEMPTPMTIEMEADERQAALDALYRIAAKLMGYVTRFSSLEDGAKGVKDVDIDMLTIKHTIDRAALQSPRVPVIEILDTVLEQAEDDGLWFNAKYASEVYLQQELRRLHAVIERAYAELQKGN